MTQKIFVTYAVGAAVAGLTAWTSLDTQAAVSFRKVALTGDAVTGTSPGVVHTGSFSVPVINAAGQTAFLGNLGPGVDNTNHGGIWSEGSGSLSLVARSGDAAPGTGAVFNLGSGDTALNTAGQIAFLDSLTGPGVDNTNNIGIWSEGSGSLGLVARKGDAAPGTGAGPVFSRFDGFNSFPVFNDAGQTAFFGTLTGPSVDNTNNKGIWSEGSGSLGLIARTGDAAPGAGAVFSSFVGATTFPRLVLNAAGQTAFIGSLTGPGVDGTNSEGIWSEGSGSLAMVAREGDAAPGTGVGVVFSRLLNTPGFNTPVINAAGQTAFLGFLGGPGVNGANQEGIWSEGSGSLGLVARDGDAAPGLGAGVVFSGFNNPVINSAGQTAFVGFLKAGSGVDTTNDAGIWSEGGGSLTLVVREGAAAPGTDPGVVFKGGFSGNTLNGAGQIAFKGNLTGPGVDLSNDTGIWVVNPNGLITLIAREGDLFDVNDDPLIDDLRTIHEVAMTVSSGGEDGRGNSFNDAGQLALRFFFTDSGGVFVATVPEPGTLVVLGLGVPILLRRRTG